MNKLSTIVAACLLFLASSSSLFANPHEIEVLAKYEKLIADGNLSVEQLRTAIKLKPNLLSFSTQGKTLLGIAADHLRPDLVNVLLGKRMQPTHLDAALAADLDDANFQKLFDRLVKKLSKPDEHFKKTFLRNVLEFNVTASPERVAYIVRKLQLDLSHSFGDETLLVLAISIGRYDIAHKLIKLGAPTEDVNLISRARTTRTKRKISMLSTKKQELYQKNIRVDQADQAKNFVQSILDKHPKLINKTTDQQTLYPLDFLISSGEIELARFLLEQDGARFQMEQDGVGKLYDNTVYTMISKEEIHSLEEVRAAVQSLKRWGPGAFVVVGGVVLTGLAACAYLTYCLIEWHKKRKKEKQKPKPQEVAVETTN